MESKALGLVATGLLLIACGGDAENPSSRRYDPNGPGAAGAGAGGTGVTSAAITCPAGIAAPVTIATDPSAGDLAVIAGAVYFRSGTKLSKVAVDGTGRTDVFTSKNLVRAFTDGKTIVAVESQNPPNASVTVTAIGDDPNNAANFGTDLVAAGTNLFGADADNVYAVGQQDQGDALYKVAKQNAGGMDQIAQTAGVVSNPQIVSGTLWYVLDQTSIYKLPAGGDTPALVATVDDGCSLAVGATHLYCTTKGAVETRDLNGANIQKAADAQTSEVPVAFAAGIASGDTVVLRSVTDDAYKNVIRAIGAGGEHLIACGRDNIGDLATDGNTVAWIEAGKGIFAAPLPK
jgi:hypothetical protein